MGLRSAPAPSSLLTPKGKLEGGTFDEVQQGEHSSRGSKSIVGSDGIFLKIQRAGPVKGRG